MRMRFSLLAIAIMAFAGVAMAVAPGPRKAIEVNPTLEAPDIATRADYHLRPDTTWWGGIGPDGLAVQDSMWNFNDGTFQGWQSIDETENDDDYFDRVTEDTFLDHGDPYQPMFPGTYAELWCGAHEDYANQHDWVDGMGYGNNWCQWAISPEYEYDPFNQDIHCTFKYFNKTEPGYDYTHVIIRCYDQNHDWIEDYEWDTFDDEIGSYTEPETWSGDIWGDPYPVVDSATVYVRFAFKFTSDGGWSDEDGDYATPYGPFAADDIELQVGDNTYVFDFEASAQGWTFERCPGLGAFMALYDESVWGSWQTDCANLICPCDMQGYAMAFVDPAHVIEGYHLPGHSEMAYSNVIANPTPDAPTAATAFWYQYSYLQYRDGTFYRPGYRVYPYTTEVNPNPHWSPRMGQRVWYYTGDDPGCYLTGADFSNPPDGTPLQPLWDSLRVTYQVITSCEQFGIPPTVCTTEGQTCGAPVIDNIRVALLGAVDAPPITLTTGHQFQDAFGMFNEIYGDPTDVAYANVADDLYMDDEDMNDWLRDTACIAGPTVTGDTPSWLCEICFKVSRKGMRQDWIPGYLSWKERLAPHGDVEEDFVCVLMDSAETPQGVYKHKFTTYFHEDDPGFDASHADYTEAQEIFPDLLFSPGTEIQYYYRARWVSGTDYYYYYTPEHPQEFRVLPTVVPHGQYDFYTPGFLYVDAYNRGAEPYLTAVLDDLGIEYMDKYDYFNYSSNFNASFARTYGLEGWSFDPSSGEEVYNGGFWGNAGCTLRQMLGYRMIFWSTGGFGAGGGEPYDWAQLDSWVTTGICDMATYNRFLLLDGDAILEAMWHDATYGQLFMLNTCDVRMTDPAIYREYNDDMNYCVDLDPVADPEYAPEPPYVTLYGNGCPHIIPYHVVDLQPGGTAYGNLVFSVYGSGGIEPQVEYAETINLHPGSHTRVLVRGFSFHRVLERDCGGGGYDPHCDPDSSCRVAGVYELMHPCFQWMRDIEPQIFDVTNIHCYEEGVDDGESELSGRVDYLYPSRPNPFAGRATIRFHLGAESDVTIAVYDLNGRVVKTLADHERFDAGENSLTWDGTDDAGARVGAGVYWVKMTTASGFESGKKMVVLK